MEERNVFANRQIANAGVRVEHETLGKNPRQTDATGRIQRIAEVFLEEPPPHLPWQKQRNEH
jgi:hypothetical protein